MKLPIFSLKFKNKRFKRKEKNVTFKLKSPESKSVFLTGDFNSWNTKSIPLKKNKNGVWSTSINLCSGRFEYKYIIDGQWHEDPHNALKSQNALGSINSVIKIIT